MAHHKYASILRQEKCWDELFEERVTCRDLLKILKSKKWKQYKQIINKDTVRVMKNTDLDNLVKKLEEKNLVGDAFKATIKEMRRHEKAKLASKKHERKKETQFSFLDVDIKILMNIRAKQLKERALLQKEIWLYTTAIYAL